MDRDFYGPELPPTSPSTSTVERVASHTTTRESIPSTKSSNIPSTKSSKSSNSSSSRKRKCSSSSDSSSDSDSSSSESNDSPRKRNRIESSGCQIIGPQIPAGVTLKSSHQESDDDDDVGWGPMPSASSRTVETTLEEIERRAKRMKDKLSGKDEENDYAPKRDTWMTELPPELQKNFGVTARTFRKNAPSAEMDRSLWSDTPAERARKEQDLIDGKVTVPSHRSNPADLVQRQKDDDYRRMVEEYNKSKDREKTLLELHREKLEGKHKHSKKDKKEKKSKKSKKEKKEKKKSKKEEKKEKKEKKKVPTERRPFDRDVDLQSSRLDHAQRQAIINRSQQLTGRFGHGHSQFL